MSKTTAKVIQLFKRPTLAEYQGLIKNWYEIEPEIFMILLGTREEDGLGEKYDLAYFYEADSDLDFINILENIIENIKIDKED